MNLLRISFPISLAPLTLALIVCFVATARADDVVTLRITGLYHAPVSTTAPAARPIWATVEGGGSDQEFEVLLLDATGAEVGKATARPGARIDLSRALPALGELRTSHWLQLAKDGTPIGSPWVVQPLLNRPPVRTKQALRPDGKTPYTRIIGWGDRLLDPENTEDVRLRTTFEPGEPTPPSGFRIYPDRDVLLVTEEGEIRIALAPDRAPNTAWNFRSLAEGGFYDRTTFHRIVKLDREGRPFVVQGGDPTGSGDGSAGYDLPMEPSDLAHDFGVISMARSDPPDSAGSQFFLCLSREGTARLDGQYCAFGWAVTGADALLALSEREIADLATGRPRVPPAIREAKLVPAPSRTPGVGRPDARIRRPAVPAAPVRTEPDR